MIVNRYPGKCQSCGTKLAVGDGFAYKNGHAWFSVCASTACHRKLGLKSPVPEAEIKKELTEDGYVLMPFDREALPLLRSMPGARWDPDKKCWKVSIEPKDLPRVIEVAKQLQLDIPDLLIEQAAEGTEESREALERAERLRDDGKGLFAFQKKGVEFLALHDRALLADEMGLGKTVQTLVALCDSRVIIICPAAVKYNWKKEIEQWRPEYKITICNGNDNLKFPDSIQELREWTISEFGDCCSCSASLDNHHGLDSDQESSNLTLGVQNPSPLNLHATDSGVGLDISSMKKPSPLAKPIQKVSVSIPNLDTPNKTTPTGFARNSGNRTLSIDDSSDVTDGTNISGDLKRESVSGFSRNTKTSGGKHLPQRISSSSKIIGNGNKRSSGNNPFVSSFKLGVSNICSRCSKHIPPKGEIVIITYNTLPSWLVPKKETGKKTSKGKDILVADLTDEQKKIISECTVICDEAHLVKNYKAARSQKVGQLSSLALRVWFLTGTPLMNSPTDLYGVLTSGNMNVFGTWFKFLKLFNGMKTPFGGYDFGMPEPEVPERMKRVMLRRLKTDVLKELPPKTYKDIEVNNLDAKFKKELDAIADDSVIEGELIPSKLPNFKEFSKIRAKLAKSRIPAMFEIVETYEESCTPLVVFSAHVEPIEELGAREGWEYITGDTSAEDRFRITEDFQAGKLKGVAVTIKAGGVGLTLTHASHALFLDLDWTPGLNIQAEDRVCRIGQKADGVLIMRMVSNHPLDIHMHRLIARKTELAYKALEESLKFKPLKKRPMTQDIKLIQESDEELEERIRNAEQEAEREDALSRIFKIAGREAVKVNDVPEPPLTSARKKMLREALEYMVSRCDGAHERDGMGFSKPDAGIAHWLDATGLRESDEIPFRVLERILVRYRRQLKGEFETIWKPE